jgi:hypothetical protein
MIVGRKANESMRFETQTMLRVKVVPRGLDSFES